MAQRLAASDSPAKVRFVPTPIKSRRKVVNKPVEPSGRPPFQPAYLDHLWDYWLRGVAMPMGLLLIASGMAIRGYAVLPLPRRGFGFRWAEFHDLDARLLAISVVGLALWCHIRGVWSEHRQLADYQEPAQTTALAPSILGFVTMLLH